MDIPPFISKEKLIKSEIQSAIAGINIEQLIKEVIARQMSPVMQSHCRHDYIKDNRFFGGAFTDELYCTYCGHKKGSIPYF